MLGQAHVIAIPKASNEAHVRDNAASLKIKLTKEVLLTDLHRRRISSEIKEVFADALTGPSSLETAVRLGLDTTSCQTL